MLFLELTRSYTIYLIITPLTIGISNRSLSLRFYHNLIAPPLVQLLITIKHSVTRVLCPGLVCPYWSSRGDVLFTWSVSEAKELSYLVSEVGSSDILLLFTFKTILVTGIYWLVDWQNNLEAQIFLVIIMLHKTETVSWFSTLPIKEKNESL